MNKALAGCRLYGIIDTGYVSSADVATRTEQLLAAGVRVLQLRAKGLPLAEVQRLALIMQPLCRRAGALFVLNDYPAMAAEIGADAVHVGQDAGPLAEVRRTVGAGIIVGRSTHSVEQARQARDEGADYIGFGPLYPTGTKPGRPSIGLEHIRRVQELAGDMPVFCIGGISPTTLPAVLAAGARRVVIVSALLQHPDPAAEAGRLLAALAKSGL